MSDDLQKCIELSTIRTISKTNMKDADAQRLADKIGGVSSVMIDGFKDREFDVVSSLYVAQTTSARSAVEKPRNYLNNRRRQQIRETLYAALVTNRIALFEFTAGKPEERVIDFILEAANELGVPVKFLF